MWPVFLMLLAGCNTTTIVDVAARVNGQTIRVHEIDAPSHAKIMQLRAELRELAARTIDQLVDERLRTLVPAIQVPAPASVTEDEISAFRESHAQDFAGSIESSSAARDPAVERAAIRYYLEQKARKAAEVEIQRRRREGRSISLAQLDAEELEQVLPPTRELAWVEGVAIPATEFERAAALRLYRLRGEIYRERRRNWEAAIDDVLLTQEASRRGISKEVLLRENERNITVSDEDIRVFHEHERAAGRSVPTAERARLYLQFHKTYARRQALLQELRAAARIEILLKEPVMPRLPVVEAGAPALGAETGPRLIVYTNYRCVSCRAVHREVDRLLAADQGVRITFRDFIPQYDPVASEAARLSRCAFHLGAFARMREELLSRLPPAFGEVWYAEDVLVVLAARLGVNSTAFMQCLSSAETHKASERDTTHARELGFDEAPAFVAEGVPLSGLQSADGLARTLRQQR